MSIALESNICKTFESSLESVRSGFADFLRTLAREYDIDIAVGPAGRTFASVVAAAGLPFALMPLECIEADHCRKLMSVVGPQATVMQAMSAWEATFLQDKGLSLILVNWQRDATKPI